jgi:hypothetical protein
MSRRARAIAEARFSWEEVSRRWIEAAYGAEFLVSRQSDNDLSATTKIVLASR